MSVEENTWLCYVPQISSQSNNVKSLYFVGVQFSWYPWLFTFNNKVTPSMIFDGKVNNDTWMSRSKDWICSTDLGTKEIAVHVFHYQMKTGPQLFYSR